MKPSLESTKVDDGFGRMLAKMWRNLASLVVNGHLGFGDGTNRDNIDGAWANVVSPGVANTDLTITHNLGRVPVGYLVMAKNATTDVYTGSVAPTTSQITLRFTGVGVSVRLFILSLLLSLAQLCYAQNVIQNGDATFNANGIVKIAASALVTVCPGSAGLPAAGVICSPIGVTCVSQTDTICSNGNGGAPTTTDPFNADINGNWFFWDPPGTYIISISGVGISTQSFTYTLGSTTGGGGGGGGGTPGGSPTQLQYNLNNSSFGGFTGSSLNNSTGALQLPGTTTFGNSGGTAGNFFLPAGTIPAVQLLRWGIGATNSIGASGLEWLGPNLTGLATQGVVWLSTTATPNVSQLHQSGDSLHSIRWTGQTASVTNAVLCASANCPAGEYNLDLHLNSTTTCGVVGTAQVVPTIGYVDDTGTQTTQSVIMVDVASTTIESFLPLGVLDRAYNIPIHFWTVGGNNITISITYTGCTTGTGTWSGSAEVTAKQ